MWDKRTGEDHRVLETSPLEPAPALPRASGSRLRLLVLGNARMTSFHLPASGDVAIGRSEDCQVSIQDGALAPLHANLRIGPTMTLIDAGSGLPSVVGRHRLEAGEACAVSPGVIMVLGGVTVVVQNTAPSTRLQHVRSHDYFEGRLEDECARADSTHETFGVVRMRCRAGQAGLVEEIFAELLKPKDVVATYAPNEYEILLIDASRESVETRCFRLRDGMAKAGLSVQLGLATYPHDARAPEALLHVAGAAIHGSKGSIPSVISEGFISEIAPLLERVAATTMSVLILGETGTGKEVVARAIHSLSSRSKKPLLSLNCAAVHEGLMESELFGHERGAFTGAQHVKPGLLESANGGTVFLDEIGEMPPTLQAKLLRVVEQKQVLRLGALTTRPVDVRFLAATNRDLESEVARGTFRRDLFFRLNGISIVIPPLRERIGEIQPLAESFIRQFCRDTERHRAPQLSPDALTVLQQYAWPGNIRELRNIVERAALLCTGNLIDRGHLPTDKMGRTLPPHHRDSSPPLEVRASDAPPPPWSFHGEAPMPAGVSASREGERERIARALEGCAGNQTHAARLLGISRRTLISRIEEYDLPRPRKPRMG